MGQVALGTTEQGGDVIGYPPHVIGVRSPPWACRHLEWTVFPRPQALVTGVIRKGLERAIFTREDIVLVLGRTVQQTQTLRSATLFKQRQGQPGYLTPFPGSQELLACTAGWPGPGTGLPGSQASLALTVKLQGRENQHHLSYSIASFSSDWQPPFAKMAALPLIYRGRARVRTLRCTPRWRPTWRPGKMAAGVAKVARFLHEMGPPLPNLYYLRWRCEIDIF